MNDEKRQTEPTSEEGFEVLADEVFHRGPLGIFCRGRRVPEGTPVHVRLFHREFAENPEIRRRLLQNAKASQELRDPHVVGVLGAGVWKGSVYYAYEPLEGQNLAGLIRDGHRFPTGDLLNVAESAARALAAAQKSGLFHRALGPSNIHLMLDGTFRVSDFGVLGCLDLPWDAPALSETFRYRSPEQAADRPPDVRSDLYSLGTVLYELAAGRTPFEGHDSVTSQEYQLLFTPPRPLRESGVAVPAYLEAVILRCLAKSPEERFASPEELLEALDTGRRTGCEPHIDDTGKFEIFEDHVIGEGGMGTLYRGRERSSGRPVAIKVIREAHISNQDFLKRFRQEAELLAELDDPAIVRVLGTGSWKDRLFYAMELVEGEDLATCIDRGRQFAADQILAIALGVARALKAAWERKIVHRDVKPANILLTADGRVKIADFGLAKSLRVPGKLSTMIAGTPEYIAPEQAMGGAADIRSDIYSLGVVLYELVTGQTPFPWQGSMTGVIYLHVHRSPPVNLLQARVPKPLATLVERCLAKRPQDRFPTPEALLDELESIRSLQGAPEVRK